MEALRPLLDVAVRPNAAVPEQLFAGIAQRQWSLEDVVKELGAYLTNKDEALRARAVGLLGSLLPVAPTLEATQAATLAAFFAARLQDYASVPDALCALLALVVHHPVSPASIPALLHALFSEVSVQALAQPARHAALSLLLRLLTTQPTAVTAQGADFVFGVVQAMDGERDPRNLLVAFQLVQGICEVMPLQVKRFEEELFELLAAYYPVSFRERLNDPPGAVSATELATALDSAFAAHSGWASSAIPFFLEKLSASTPGTPAQVLRTLRRCVSQWPGATLAPLVELLWPALQRAVQDNTETEAALAALRELAEQLAKHDVRALKRLVAPALAAALPTFQPSVAAALPSARLLSALASVSLASEEITTTALPLLLTAASNADTVAVHALSVLVGPLLTASPPAASLPPLLLSTLSLLSKLSSTASPSVQALALPPLALLLSRLPDLTALTALVNALQPSLTPAVPSASSSVPSTPAAVLAHLASTQSNAVAAHVLPVLLARIEQSTSPAELSLLSTVLVSLLRSAPALLAPIALPPIATLVSQSADPALLSALLAPLASEPLALGALAEHCHTHLLPALLPLSLHPSLVPLLCALIARLAPSAPTPWISTQLALFDALPQPLTLPALTSVVLPAAALASAPLLSPLPSLPSLLLCLHAALVDPAIASAPLRSPFLTLLAALVNKHPGAPLDAFLRSHVLSLWAGAVRTNGSEHAAEALLYCAAAQALRGELTTAQSIASLLSSAPIPVTLFLARSFSALLGDAPLPSPVLWTARQTVLHRQRLFSSLLPSLEAALPTSTTERRSALLLACMRLFAAVPTPVLLAIPSRVSSLILQASAIPVNDVRLAALALLASLLPNMPDLVGSLHSLLGALIAATLPTSSHALLSEALRCLRALLCLPPSRLVSHRPAVLQALAKCLDHPRRDIRQQAAAVRNSWFLLPAFPEAELNV